MGRRKAQAISYPTPCDGVLTSAISASAAFTQATSRAYTSAGASSPSSASRFADAFLNLLARPAACDGVVLTPTPTLPRGRRELGGTMRPRCRPQGRGQLAYHRQPTA